MNSLKIGLFAALLLVASAMLAQGILSSSYRFGNVGSVKAIGVGVYWDAACTSPVSSIAWGVLEPGETKNVTVYIRNEGNSMATLAMRTENWRPPEAGAFIELTWDYDGQWLAPMAVIPVTFSLHLSGDVQNIDSFAFDIIISAVG